MGPAAVLLLLWSPQALPPSSAADWKAAGVAEVGAQRMDAAAAAFGKACELDPKDEDACYFFGRTLSSLDQWEKARGPFEKALRAASPLKLAQKTDGPIAALVDDLKARGLFDETLIVIGSEFGRTPMIQNSGLEKLGCGRDHNPPAFTVLLAGGGVKGGMAYGVTDEFGFKAIENRVHVHDLHATILHQLGFDHTRLTYRHAGRDFRLTDVHGEVVKAVVA